MAVSTIDSNSLNATSDLTINGVTVGKGGGAVSTNTAVGASALTTNSSGANNTAVGYQAGYSGVTAPRNTSIGYRAGYANTTGYNCFIGTTSGTASTGYGNTFVGSDYANGCGALVTSGNNNTILGGYSGNQGGLDIRTGSNYIVLSDGDGNPRGIFNNSGYLMLGGAVSTPYNETLRINTANQQGIHIQDTTNSSSINIQYFTRLVSGTATESGRIYWNGSAMQYLSSSDYRLKKDVSPMTNGLETVMKLNPVNFVWKHNDAPANGFIAHELQEHCPDAVSGEKDALNEDGSMKVQSIDTSFLVATLTAAIQELKTIVDAQAAEIAELKAKVA